MPFAAFRMSAVLSAAGLAAGLAILAPGGIAFAQQQSPQHPPVATGIAHPAGAPGAAKEDHPKMEAALRELDKARSELASAAQDFHGHRAKALELVSQASQEIRQGLASDKD